MKKNILLVEDDPALRMVMREVLKDEFEIEEADNGLDGIDKGLKPENDLIILDYHLPKKDGLEVIEAIKKQFPNVPVIVLSGFLSPKSEAQFNDLGATKIFPKPFNYRNLLETVRSLTTRANQVEQAPACAPASMASHPPLSETERQMLTDSLNAVATLAEKIEYLQSVSEKYWIEPADISSMREAIRCMETEVQRFYGKMNNSLFNAGEFSSPLLTNINRPSLSGQN
ncbi:response regulator [Pelagicoccus sp. SDUM812003]|uniref:response regulator n=1 Tax=Pelagicoccus sp. SDUM812003 TaxID=3041267 RepID=UPI0028108AEC|nr:response regulator [Pelagicoccus sp. SDUM812003]MDQ8201585.1 response regulator [Pelagicoccus sp. SDUM812003]